jgi:hypothetical protein
LHGQLWNQEEEKKRGVTCAKAYIHLEHALHLDGEEAETNRIPPWKLPYDHRMTSHAPPKKHGDIYMLACLPHMSTWFF